jgi:hypothetical protein
MAGFISYTNLFVLFYKTYLFSKRLAKKIYCNGKVLRIFLRNKRLYKACRVHESTPIVYEYTRVVINGRDKIPAPHIGDT